MDQQQLEEKENVTEMLDEEIGKINNNRGKDEFERDNEEMKSEERTTLGVIDTN
jgi:hypothetical protein